MKKNSLRFAAMTAASVLSCLLCGTAASASTETVDAVRMPNSFLVEYTVSGLPVGDSCSFVLQAIYDDTVLDYQGYFSALGKEPQKKTGYISINSNNFSAASETMTLASLKFFWADANFSYRDALGEPEVVYSDPDDGYTIKKNILGIGDVNGDLVVNETDYQLLFDSLTGKETLTNDYRKRADVNLDGMITMTDLYMLNSWMDSTENTPIWGAN